MVLVELWMKTTSDCGRRPTRSRATSALCDSPLKLSRSEIRFGPTAFPMAKARITKTSHPQKALFRCLLLQRAIRAARLCEDGCESIYGAPDEPRYAGRAWPTLEPAAGSGPGEAAAEGMRRTRCQRTTLQQPGSKMGRTRVIWDG